MSNEILFSQSAIDHIKSVKNKTENSNKFLRISVSGGGCSGFQYIFELDDQQKEGDIKLLEEETILAVTDEISLPFLNGSTIDYVKELGAKYFKVKNPNASSSCGCGSSFSV